MLFFHTPSWKTHDVPIPVPHRSQPCRFMGPPPANHRSSPFTMSPPRTDPRTILYSRLHQHLTAIRAHLAHRITGRRVPPAATSPCSAATWSCLRRPLRTVINARAHTLLSETSATRRPRIIEPCRERERDRIGYFDG